MKKIKKISIFILIQVFLVSNYLWAMQDVATLSPRLNLQYSIIQPVFNRQTSMNKLPMFALDDYEDLKELVKKNIEFSNIYLLNNYRFDLNASFFKKYSSVDPEKVSYNAVDDAETYRGGICLELSVRLQRQIYESILDKRYFSKINPGMDVHVEVIKPLGEELVYELGILINGQKYRVRGYIIGSIAADKRTKIKAQESEYLRIIHFSSMTKIVAPDGRQFRIVGEPGWGIKKGITMIPAGRHPESHYSIRKTSDEHIDLLIQQSPELRWLNETAEGRRWRKYLKQNGITLFYHFTDKLDLRYIFFDKPLKRRIIDSFKARCMHVSASSLQKIVRTNADNMFDAAVSILIKPGDSISTEKFSLQADFMFKSQGAYRSGQFSYEQLLQIIEEIEHKISEEYSQNTWMFINTGIALNLINPQALQTGVWYSEFYRRFKVLLDSENLNHYLQTLNAGVVHLDMEGFKNVEDLFNQRAWVTEQGDGFADKIRRYFDVISEDHIKREEYAFKIFNLLGVYISEEEKDFFLSQDHLKASDFIDLILDRIETARGYKGLADGYELVKYYAASAKDNLKKDIIIREVETLMKEKMGVKFAADYHHGLQHAKDLIKKAKELIKKLNRAKDVDWKVLAAAIYLHDIYAGRSEENHGEDAAAWAEEQLGTGEYFTKEQVDKVKQAVQFHDKKISIEEDKIADISLETKILYDADNMDAFGIKGVYRYFSAHIMREGGRGKKAREVLDHIKKRVSYNAQKRYENLYFDASREMVKHDYPITRDFFKKLMDENYLPGDCFGATGVFSFVWGNFQSAPWVIADKAISFLENGKNAESIPADAEFTRDYFKQLLKAYENVRGQISGKATASDLEEKDDFSKIFAFIEQSI